MPIPPPPPPPPDTSTGWAPPPSPPPPPPPPPEKDDSQWAPAAEDAPADHEHEAEAVLRQLEEEIAREAAEAGKPAEEVQVTPDPKPEVEDEVETDTDTARVDTSDVPESSTEPVTDDRPAPPAGGWQPQPSDAAPVPDAPAEPSAPSQDWSATPPADDRPAPPASPAPPVPDTDERPAPAGDETDDDEDQTLGWTSADTDVPVADERPAPVADETDDDEDQTLGWTSAGTTIPVGEDRPSAPMFMPPAQRGVPPLPPPPTVPTGWLIDDPDQTEAPTYGPATPAETPAYLYGAYSQGPTATRIPSGPPAGLPRVRMPQPPWWRKQATLIVGAAAVLVVLLGVFAFVVLKEDSPSLTYNGDSIEDAEGTLTSAERTVDAIVDERHGASNDDTRCYFSLKNADATDVADHLRCGPVLFVDGDEEQPYLTFALTQGDEEGDGVKLVAADQPEAPEPTKLDSGEELRRPDDASPPSGAGGLEVPLPQRADAGLFEANPLEGVELQDPGGDAEIVSYGTSYRMTGFAEPDRYGSGDAARRPASGEKFVAVQFDVGLGEFPMVTDNPTLAVQIGDEAPTPLPGDPEATLDSMILSVPEDADVVDLVVTEQGVEQRLSLVDGTPGANNISVLRRDTLDHITSASADMSFSASRPGYVTETFTVNVGIPAVRLFWFFGDGGVQHPSGPGRAWLVPETTHAWGAGLNAGPDVSLDPEFFKLTLADGTVVSASNLATDGRILVAFDVPADFSQGTLTVGGVVTRFNGETWDFGGSNLTVPVNIPAG